MLFVTTFNVSAENSIDRLKMNNKEFYLGSASISGDGSSSVLEAIVDNDLLIDIDSKSEFVDFYIDYEMNCDGPLDEGTITLSIILNGENSSSNLTISLSSKSGRLYVENVEVTRRDSLVFIIGVVYTSLSPIYHNETVATGAGVISKHVSSRYTSFNLILELLEYFMNKKLIISEILFLKYK
jgi:hypothetical protein